MPSRTLPFCFVAFNVITFSSDARAQENTNSTTTIETKASTQVVEIKNDGKKYDARREDTVTKFVITREEIERHGDSSVAEILNRQAGIINGNINGLRGYTQYLVDGQDPPRGFSISDISASQIERIEIIRSAVAEFSTQAIGGTINIVLQRLVKTRTRKLEMALRYQDQSPVSRKLQLNYADKFDNFSLDTTFFINQPRYLTTEQDYFENTDTDLLLTEIRNRHQKSKTTNSAFALTQDLTWSLGDHERISVNAYAARIIIRQDSLATTFDTKSPSTTTERETNFTYWTPQNIWLKLSWDKPLIDQAKLQTTLYVLRGDLSSNNGASSSTPTQFREFQSNMHRKSNILSWKGKILFQKSETDTQKIGWHIENKEYQSENIEGSKNVASQHLRSAQAAFFAEKERDASDQWSNYLGVRWEGFRSEISAPFSASSSQISSVLSPIVQTRWKPHKQAEDQVRFALTRTFRNPDQQQFMAESFSNFGQDIYTPVMVGNPKLRPEIAWGLDIAFEHFSENEINYSLSHYLKTVKNLMRDRLFIENKQWQQQTINSGNGLAHGLVADSSFPLSIWFKGAPKISVTANLSRNWSHVNDVPGPNNRFAEQAKFNANVGLEYQPNDAWNLRANYGVISGGPLRIAADRINIEQVTRSTSVAANWDIDQGKTIHFQISNFMMQPTITQTTLFSQNKLYYSRRESRGLLNASLRLSMNF
ncbi:TonB-dependent receptor [Undibacterium sp. LX40W]|uniref:TonB-dependent receptor n=1 Tax=Undibacterium nitidum TaxID=2762298 RepID=A0A923HK10_9BURK|nr:MULTISPECIES: TonB-dependent receptor [Undibacterium]MBC3880819.1 TonB-dependent receptor [Undibacterium nitidum]MBC3890448.1 TonB-dependent receptor [Undibacterium sp. LX40W]